MGERMNLFILCIPFLHPLASSSVVSNAVDRFRTDLNRINPFYRLSANIYHWNYKFSQPTKKKRNQRVKPHPRQRRKKNSKQRVPLPRPILRAKRKRPTKVKDDMQPTNKVEIKKPAYLVSALSNINDNLLTRANDKTVKVLVTEMHEMIHQLLLAQNLMEFKHKKDESQDHVSVREIDEYNIDEEKTEFVNENGSATMYENNNAHWTPLNYESTKLSYKDPIVARLDDLIATIERIKRNPVWKEHKQSVYPYQRFTEFNQF